MPEGSAQKFLLTVLIIAFCLFASFSFYTIYTWNTKDSLDLQNKVVDSVNQSVSGKIVSITGNTILLEKFSNQLKISTDKNTLVSRSSSYQLIPYDPKETTNSKLPPIIPTVIPNLPANDGNMQLSDLKIGDFVYATIEIKNSVKFTSSIVISTME